NKLSADKRLFESQNLPLRQDLAVIFRKPSFAHVLWKSRIAANRSPNRVNVEIQHAPTTLLVGPLQPAERIVFVAKVGVEERGPKSRNIMLMGHRFPRLHPKTNSSLVVTCCIIPTQHFRLVLIAEQFAGLDVLLDCIFVSANAQPRR